MRICSITHHQVINNPRLFREADALSNAGHDVRVIAVRQIAAQSELDRDLASRRSWRLQTINLEPPAWTWFYTGIRRKLATKMWRQIGGGGQLAGYAYTRTFSETVGQILSEPVDLIIAHTQPMLAPAFYAAKQAECLWGFDCEDILSEEYGEGIQDARHQKLVRTLEDQFIPQADYVTCASLPYAGWIRENYDTEAVVVRNVPSLADAPSKLEFAFGSSRSYLSLHWFSQSIGPLRGLEDAVRALPHVMIPVQLHLRGTLLPGYAPKLCQLISEMGVSDRVFFHERIEPDALIRSAAQHDVGLALMQPCCLNHQLAVPNKIFTYMMAGLAVLATDTEGHRSVAKEAPEAILTYEPGNHLQLAQRINAFSDRELLRRVRESAFRFARSCFNWESEQRIVLETIAKLDTVHRRKVRKNKGPVPRSVAVRSSTEP